MSSAATQSLIAKILRDPFALGALIVIVGIASACIAAPWIAPSDAVSQRLWCAGLPPGAVHPDAPTTLRLEPGRPAVLPPQLRGAEALRVTTTVHEVAMYRAAIKRGVLDLRQGATPVPRLVIAAGAAQADADAAGNAGDPLPAMTLEHGRAAPDGLFPAGMQVRQIRIAQGSATVLYHVQLDGAGTVTLLEREIAASASAAASRTAIAEAIELSGADIVRLERRDAASDARDYRDVTIRHWLGTDMLGRDVLARLLWGGRISLLIGLVATLVSVVIGVLVGAFAGWHGGRIDRVLMGAVDVLYAVPFMFLVIVLMVVFERSIFTLFAALGAVQWLTMARIVRGQVLTLSQREFVLAARTAGLSSLRIVFRYVLPNCLGPILVYATLTVPLVIMEESFLAFVGLSVQQAGVDSWGAQVEYGNSHLVHATFGRWWLLVVPAGAMVLTLVALTVLGERLRRHADPRR